MFTFCFDKPCGTPTFSLCHYKKTVESGDWYGVPDITFTSDIKGIPNPIAFDMNNLEERKVRLSVRLRDAEPSGGVTYILTMHKNMTFTGGSSSWRSEYHTEYKDTYYFKIEYRYRAYCNPNYYGRDCTVYCKPRTGLYTCTSDGQKDCVLGKGWQGDNCDEDVDECETTPDICSRPSSIFHHYACNNTIGSYKCVCATGWKGSNCDEDVDECKTTPDICSFPSSIPSSIFHHYVCNNTIGSYKCVCAAGWKGSNCDEDVDECQGVASLPCLNGGNCTVGSYRCICPNASNGSRCSDDVDGCVNVTSPCPPDQPRCVNVIGGYNCADKESQNQEDEDTFLWWPIVVAVVVVVAVAVGIAGFVLKRQKQRKMRSIGCRNLPSATDLNNSAGAISIVHKHGPPGLSSDPRVRGRLPVPRRNSSVSSKFTDSMVGSMYEGVEDRFQQGGVVLKGRRPSSEYLQPIPGKVGSPKSGFPRQDSATLAKDSAGSVNNASFPSEAAKAERSGAEDYSLHRCLSVSVSNSSNVYYTANATDDSYSNFEPPAYSSLRSGGP
ncbi:uncharacterized protein [Littorina saxatilis]|uniref:uncharacterized protein n=1 Tax=Littorina saxatilis TaxID=31220 RepID=UPI0038B49B0C